MNSVLWALVIFAAVGIGLWLVSFAIEAIGGAIALIIASRRNPSPRW